MKTNERIHTKSCSRSLKQGVPDSLRPMPDDNVNGVFVQLTPLQDLDLMIENGWGDTPRNKIPNDWRTRINI